MDVNADVKGQNKCTKEKGDTYAFLSEPAQAGRGAAAGARPARSGPA